MTEFLKKMFDDYIPQDAFFFFAVTWTAWWCVIGALQGFGPPVEGFISGGFGAIVARWPMPKETENADIRRPNP